MIKIFTVFAFIFSVFAFGQSIKWNSTKQLKWSDFQNPVKPTKEQDVVAITSTGINYLVSQQKGSPNKVQLHISAVFSQKNSWKNSEGLTKEALDHEQGHFDIAELYARKIKAEVSKKIITKSDFDKNFKALYDRYYSEYLQFQKKYDVETNRGLNTEQQRKYRALINQQLN